MSKYAQAFNANERSLSDYYHTIERKNQKI